MERHRHIVWDLGGTLVDTYPALDRAFAEVVAAAGHAVELDEVAALTRVSTSHAVETLAARFGIEPIRFETANERLKARWQTHPAPVMRGAHQLMADVRAAGGLNLVATHRDRASAESLVHGLQLRIDDMICAPDGFPRKPDPTMLTRLLERHGLAPETCLAVGDRPIDAGAATAAGVASALFDGAGGEPTHTIHTLDDLRTLVHCKEPR